MKKFIIAVVISLFLFTAIPAQAVIYCYIENGQLVEGPGRVPHTWHGIPGFGLLSAERIKPYGWIPYVQVKPEYDKDTQYLTSERVITEDAVTDTYTAHDYSQEQMVQRIANAKRVRKLQIRKIAKSQLEQQYANWVGTDDTAIDALTTIAAVRDYVPTAPDEEALEVVRQKQANARAAIIASGIANLTYAQIDTHVEDTFSGLTADQKTSLKKLYKSVLAIMKRLDWSD